MINICRIHRTVTDEVSETEVTSQRQVTSWLYTDNVLYRTDSLHS